MYVESAARHRAVLVKRHVEPGEQLHRLFSYAGVIVNQAWRVSVFASVERDTSAMVCWFVTPDDERGEQLYRLFSYAGVIVNRAWGLISVVTFDGALAHVKVGEDRKLKVRNAEELHGRARM